MSFQNVLIPAITINRNERQRRDLGDLQDLADSISRIGLLNPIIITHENVLVAGERRLAACTALGWTHIPAQYREDLSPLEQRQVELDENIRRLDLPWKDRALALVEYYQVGEQLHGKDWSLAKMAEEMGEARETIGVWHRVGQALVEDDPRIVDAPRFSVARNILERAAARAKNVADEELESLVEEAYSDTPVAEEPVERKKPKVPILNEDFTSWVDKNRTKFNLIHCDFPYGIQADKHNQGAAPEHGGYDDTPEMYKVLLKTFIQAQENFTAKAAHLVFWFSPVHYEYTVNRLSAGGWNVNPYPLIWHKSDNSGIIPDPRRMPRQVYEMALLCSRGDRFIVRARSNLFPAPLTKDYHMSEKNFDMLTYFLSMLVDETTHMLDPTCGCGNAVIAAHQLGAKKVLGLEINPEFHQLAKENWNAKSRELAEA